jgi:DNA-binding GntR family transcriptional regulator
VALGMSQAELALLLGASRPKVNAALMTLEDAGAITRSGQAFACDVAVLAEIARREHRST